VCVAYTFCATRLREPDPSRLTVPNTPIQLDLTEFFAQLVKKTGRSDGE
jgi:hypothetical protein